MPPKRSRRIGQSRANPPGFANLQGSEASLPEATTEYSLENTVVALVTPGHANSNGSNCFRLNGKGVDVLNLDTHSAADSVKKTV